VDFEKGQAETLSFETMTSASHLPQTGRFAVKKIQKILAPVDFSKGSANSLKYAAQMAQETGSELIVLHVFDKNDRSSVVDSLPGIVGWPIPPHIHPSITVDRRLRENSLDLYNFIQNILGNLDRVNVRRRVEMGNPGKEIIRAARVAALKSRSLFSYLTARSILIKLTLRSPCPVLLTH
jgi:nucleotide-binding universal stress UspA family protein